MQDVVSYRLGIDIGGTFTDFAMIENGSGAVSLEKILTTPHDPSVAVLDGIDRLLTSSNAHVGQIVSIVPTVPPL